MVNRMLSIVGAIAKLLNLNASAGRVENTRDGTHLQNKMFM